MIKLREINTPFNERKVDKMNDYVEIENFQNGPMLIGSEGYLKNLTNTLDNDLSEWDLVRVPIKHEFIDELTETIKYELRYRLYLSKVYEMLGFDSFIANRYSGYYWEKDKNGNITDYYLP